MVFAISSNPGPVAPVLSGALGHLLVTLNNVATHAVLELDSYNPVTQAPYFQTAAGEAALAGRAPTLFVGDLSNGVMASGVAIYAGRTGYDVQVGAAGNNNEGLLLIDSTGSFTVRIGTNVNGYIAGVTIGGPTSGTGAVDGITFSTPNTGTVEIQAAGLHTNVNLNLVTQGSGQVLVNGSPIGGGGVTWPLTNSGDMGFQPDGVANNVLLLQQVASSIDTLTIASPFIGQGIAITATDGLTIDATGSGSIAIGQNSQQVTIFGTVNVDINISSGGISVTTGAGVTGLFEINGQLLSGGSTAGQAALTVTPNANGVNGVTITGTATGSAVTIASTGSDSNPGLQISTKNNGVLSLIGGSTTGVMVKIQSGATTGSVALGGSAGIGTAGEAALTATGVAAGVNGVTHTQAATGNPALMAATGGDTNVGLTINAKNTGTILIGNVSTGAVTITPATTHSGVVTHAAGTKSTVITSGALSTQLFVSTTGAQVLTTRDVFLFTPVTFTPTGGASATCVVAISPDNTTYTTLTTVTVPLGTALDSFILPVSVWLPAGWYAKFTTTNATLGTSTYW